MEVKLTMHSLHNYVNGSIFFAKSKVIKNVLRLSSATIEMLYFLILNARYLVNKLRKHIALLAKK